MTDKEKLEAIRAEIERLKKENETHVDKDYAESQKWHMHGAYHVLFELSNFIDSLTEEPVSEGLEEASSRNLWKPADGDDLPEYEREVVVFTQNFPDDAGMMRVAIGHRPNPDGWDGKSLSTGKVEHYTPKTYGKGGWNIPDIKWWLDVGLPKEIEL